MNDKITKEELQDFALNFDNDIAKPFIKAGFDKYNIFDILNINRQELRHSDFLAFLFDPKKSGDIGRQFLKNFLALLAKEVNPTLDFYTMLYGNIENADVSREVFIKDGRIDILIDLEISKEKTEKILIAIENKVDSKEHDKQLVRYKNFLEDKKYNGYKKIMLLLSPDKTESNDDRDWVAIDYFFIYQVLDMVDVEDAENTIKILINDYKQKIRSEFKMDINDELKQQAIEIYKKDKNKKIFDFIFNSVQVWRGKTGEIIRGLIEVNGGNLRSKRANTNIMFETTALKDFKGYYFQLNLNDMSFYLCDGANHIMRSQWLFENGQKSVAEAKRFEDEYVFDLEKLNDKCNRIIEGIFEPNGIITECLKTLH